MNKNFLSVIVPNYNYAHFLKRRLDSIACQTITPEEIIFLDDCSTDNSLEVAEQLLKSYGIAYTIVANDTNQGVFLQWLKGIRLAKYDHIWIAEADDLCEPDLLEKLLPAFDDLEVAISYCQSKIIDVNNPGLVRTHGDDIAKIIDAARWQNSYANSCYDEARNYLSVTSTIANASAVLLKKSLLPLDRLELVAEYKMAGDWLFYLLVLYENPNYKISYCSDLLNLWYKHGTNIWADQSKAQAAYIECLKIYGIILNNYNVALPAKSMIYKLLVKHYLNQYIADDAYYKLLFSVIDLSGNKSVWLTMLQVTLQIKQLRTGLVYLAKSTRKLKYRLKWLL
jgi:glycosyltransferase involved in cell wall biosynthesis